MKQESRLTSFGRRNQKALRVLLALFFVAFGTLVTAMIHGMCSIPGHGGYFNDSIAHIETIRQGEPMYSLAYLLIGLFAVFLNSQLIFSLFFSLVMIASMLVSYRMLRYLLPKAPAGWLWTAALACNLVAPVFLPGQGIFDGFYSGVFCPTIYHNLPYALMKLFSLITMLLFFRLRETYQTKLSLQDWLLFAASLFLTTWAKPNFIFAFAPVMALILLVDLIANKGKGFWKCVWFGTCVFPSLLLLLYQNIILFSGDSGNQIAFGWGVHLRIWSTRPLLSLVQSLAFPLFLLLFNLKELKLDKKYRTTWLMLLAALMEYLVLYEAGPRKAHGNFLWGLNLMVFFVFLISAYKLIQNFTKDKRENRLRRRSPYYIAALSLLAVHLVTGLIYFGQYILYYCIGI